MVDLSLRMPYSSMSSMYFNTFLYLLGSNPSKDNAQKSLLICPSSFMVPRHVNNTLFSTACLLPILDRADLTPDARSRDCEQNPHSLPSAGS